MNAITLQRTSPDLLAVSYAGKPIGCIELYSNAFHSGNQYLRLYLDGYSHEWAAQLFSQLRDTVGKPLQVMLPSTETGLAAFLTAGGFVCRRKCYEMELSAAAFMGSPNPQPLKMAEPGQPEYIRCCQLLFDRYRENHRAINPLTADFETFSAALPATAFYEAADGELRHAAFVEENEIAYIASTDVPGLRLFASAVVSALLAEYNTVCFECDDCDAAAMTLLGLFSEEPAESYDTYIRGESPWTSQ